MHPSHFCGDLGETNLAVGVQRLGPEGDAQGGVLGDDALIIGFCIQYTVLSTITLERILVTRQRSHGAEPGGFHVS